MPRGAITLVAAGIAVGLAGEWSAYLPERPGLAAGDFAVGIAFVVGGALALRRSTATAALMAATGFAWFVGGFATGLVFLHRGPLVHLLLSYPRGRLDSRFDRVVVGFAYADALVYPLGRSNIGTLALLAAVLAAAVVRHARAGGAERRARASALAASGLVVSVLGVAAVARLSDAGGETALLWAYQGVLTLVAAGLCADLLWGRWTRAAVTGLVADLGDLEREATLRGRLARSVGDPSLELGYWDHARRRYVDEADEPLELPAAPSARSTLLVDDETGGPAAAIVHDPAALGEPGLAEAVRAAVRIAVANVALEGRVRAKVEEVRASRRRLVEVADLERRRLEGELHDAAEPRLRALEQLLTDTGPELDEVRGEVEAVREELGELARGLHPRSLTESGLGAALVELGRGFPFPVEVGPHAGRLPAPVAAAAYFFCSEALSNAAKHAHPSRAWISIQASGPNLLVDVGDDGMGGADPAGGSGLRGLADRVEALDGRFTLDSPAGAGTRLRARLPIPQGAAASEGLAAGSAV